MNHIQAKNFAPNPFPRKRSDFFSSLLGRAVGRADGWPISSGGVARVVEI